MDTIEIRNNEIVKVIPEVVIPMTDDELLEYRDAVQRDIDGHNDLLDSLTAKKGLIDEIIISRNL